MKRKEGSNSMQFLAVWSIILLWTLPPLSTIRGLALLFQVFIWPVEGSIPILTPSQNLLSRFFSPWGYIKRHCPWEQAWDSVLQLEGHFIWLKLFPKGTDYMASGIGASGRKSAFVAWSLVTSSLAYSVPGSLRVTGSGIWLANKALAPCLMCSPHLQTAVLSWKEWATLMVPEGAVRIGGPCQSTFHPTAPDYNVI